MKGLIFIPDISGFTDFVRNTNIEIGASITIDLFNEIINTIPLQLELTEIEGDALLFYKMGEPIPLKDMLAAFKSIDLAFNSRFRELKVHYHLSTNLSLKCIVHYGELKVYNIKGFRNLFGQAVIESHNLLKNGCGESEYILVTEDYLGALKHNPCDTLYSNCDYTSNSSSFCAGLKSIPYRYYKSVVKEFDAPVVEPGTDEKICNPQYAVA